MRKILPYVLTGFIGFAIAGLLRQRRRPIPNPPALTFLFENPLVEAFAERPPAHSGSQSRVPTVQPQEIVNIVRACFGAKPDVRSVKRVFDEEALPLKLERNYPR